MMRSEDWRQKFEEAAAAAREAAEIHAFAQQVSDRAREWLGAAAKLADARKAAVRLIVEDAVGARLWP